MPKLHLEIDYTHGTKSDYDWMEDEVGGVLSEKLSLDSEVTTNNSAIDGLHDVHSDSDLYELTKRIIKDSNIRKNAENNNDWYVHLLISQEHQFGYLGVMYDLAFDSRERQGCAVFTTAIRQLSGSSLGHQKRVLKRTALHEIGHCVNLIHRFDKTIMTQTSELTTTANWINNISFDYAEEDRDFVRSDKDAMPGGGTTRAVDGNDVADRYAPKSGLKIELKPFPGNKDLLFPFGEPVCGLLRIKNTTAKSIELLTPLTTECGNIKVHVTGPDEKDKSIHKSPIVACGPRMTIKITAGESHNIPINLFADRNGYMFSKAGKQIVSFAIRLKDGKFVSSKNFEISLVDTTPKVYGNNIDTTALRFIALGGSSDKTVLNKFKKQASRKTNLSKRTINWNLFYSYKHDAYGSVKYKNINASKFELLIEAATKLLKVEQSPIRRGKILLDRTKALAYAELPPRKLTAKNRSDIKAYKNFRKNMIKK